MKLLEKKRDELAHARAIQIDKKYKPNDLTVYANARHSYVKGFDAAVKELEPMITWCERFLEATHHIPDDVSDYHQVVIPAGNLLDLRKIIKGT